MPDSAHGLCATVVAAVNEWMSRPSAAVNHCAARGLAAMLVSTAGTFVCTSYLMILVPDCMAQHACVLFCNHDVSS